MELFTGTLNGGKLQARNMEVLMRIPHILVRFYEVTQIGAERLQRRIWHRGVKLFWYRLWVRDDEFHPSLEMDHEALIDMSEEEERAYRADLRRRRCRTHQKES